MSLYCRAIEQCAELDNVILTSSLALLYKEPADTHSLQLLVNIHLVAIDISGSYHHISILIVQISKSFVGNIETCSICLGKCQVMYHMYVHMY